MPGGGALNVGPGQFTDDGELTLSLCYALVKKWYKSHPFDCGRTCARAFHVQEGSTLSTILSNAARYNMLSEANGALMRVSPIAIFFQNEPTHVNMPNSTRVYRIHPKCVNIYNCTCFSYHPSRSKSRGICTNLCTFKCQDMVF